MNRFERSIRKLYEAFVSGELNAMYCSACAAGNLCSNRDYWSEFREDIGVFYNFPGEIYMKDYELKKTIELTNSGLRKKINEVSEYSPEELITIEEVFLNAMGIHELHTPESQEYSKLSDEKKTEKNFLGLCALVDYLAKLDDVKNPMDFKALFAREKELEEVF